MRQNSFKQKVLVLVLTIVALMAAHSTALATSKTVTYKIKAENASGTNRWTLTFERSGDSFGYSTGQKTAIIDNITSTSGFNVVLDDGLGLQLSVTNGSRLAVTNKDGYHGVMLNFQSDQNTYLSVGSQHYCVTHVKMANLDGDAISGQALAWMATSGALDQDVDMVTENDGLTNYRTFSAHITGSQTFAQLTITYGDPREYAITYANAVNGQNGVTNTNRTTYNVTTADFQITAPTRTGYTLSGMTYTDAQHPNATAASLPMTIERGKAHDRKAIAFTANWTVNDYTVTLDNQSATTAGTTAVTATFDAAMPSITVPEKTGYTFGGYYTAANGGGTKYYNADGTSAHTWDIASATTLYAYWIGYALKRVNGINYSPEPAYSDATYHYYAAGTEITLTPTHEHTIITAVYPTTLNPVIAANKRSATFTMPAQDVELIITQREVYAVTLPEGITLSASGDGEVYHIEGTTYCRYADASTWYTLNAPFGYSISNTTYDGSPTTINNGKNGFYLKQKDAVVTATQTDQFGISDDADGTQEKPYVITSPEGLTLLTTYSGSQTSGKYFELGDDITYTPTGADGEHNFDGIQSFGGTFDGKGNTISGIRIYQTTSKQGLFQEISGGTVKNVVLNNARVRGTSDVGGIVGYIKNSTIQNCLVLNSVITETSNDNYKGVIAGNYSLFSASNNLYRNCSVNELTNNVGANNIDRDWASQAFTITLPAGVSAATGNSLTYDGTTYYGSYENTVTLTYDNLPGGKVPWFTVTSVDNSSLVAETTSTFTMPKADVSVSVDLLHNGYTLTLPDDVTATGITYTSGSDTYYLSGTTISLSYLAEGYEVVCYVNGSALEGNSFTITGNTVVTVATNDVWGIADGADGSKQKPYVITTTAGLDLLAKKVNGTGIYSKNGNFYAGQFFNLGADITYTHKAANEEGADTESNYTPIRIFCGTFDGKGKTISGIRIYQSGNNLGLFSNISSGYVQNVTISDARITGQHNVGGIVGENAGIIKNCLVIGTSVAGTSDVGAIVGINDHGGHLDNNHYSGCIINGELKTKGVGTGNGDTDDALPAVVLRNDVANTSVIADNKGSGKVVVLYGRTLYKDGAWNTLCLPFPLDIYHTILATQTSVR